MFLKNNIQKIWLHAAANNIKFIVVKIMGQICYSALILLYNVIYVPSDVLDNSQNIVIIKVQKNVVILC